MDCSLLTQAAIAQIKGVWDCDFINTMEPLVKEKNFTAYSEYKLWEHWCRETNRLIMMCDCRDKLIEIIKKYGL